MSESMSGDFQKSHYGQKVVQTQIQTVMGNQDEDQNKKPFKSSVRFKDPKRKTNRPTQTQRSTKMNHEDQDQRESQEEIFQFNFDEVDYQLIVEKKIVDQQPEFPIYEIQVDQPLYQNDYGVQANIDLNIIDQWGIKITCISDHYCYTGMLTEQEINQNQQVMTIDDVFNELIDDFYNPELINQENESIQIQLNDENMELTQTLEMKKGKNNEIQEPLQWNLKRQKYGEIVDKNIIKIIKIVQQNRPLKVYIKQELNRQLERHFEKMQQQKQENTSKQEITSKLQEIQQITQQLNEQLAEISQSQQQGIVRFSSECVKGVSNCLQQINNQSQQGSEAPTQTQQEDQKQRQIYEENSSFYLDQLKVEKINCQLPEFLQFCDNDGINWYYQNDQQLIQQKDGKQMLRYKNNKGEQAKIDQNIKDYQVIKISCHYDDYCYTGMLTEQEITQNQQQIPIDEVVQVLNYQLNPELNQKENKSVHLNLKKNDQIIELNLTLITKQPNKITTHILKWNLLRQNDQQMLEKTINNIHKHTDQIMKKLEQQQQQQQQVTKDTPELEEQSTEFQKNIKNSLDKQMQEFNSSLDQLHTLLKEQAKNKSDKLPQEQITDLPQQNDQIILKPSDLTKTSQLFFVSPQCVKGVTTLKFTIKELNQMGLVIGLDQNNNPVNNQYMYSIYISKQMLMIGKTKIKFEYTLQVGHKICLRVDMNQRQVILLANQEQITDFQLEDQGEAELFIFVGYFEPFEEINNFIE